MQVSLKYNNIFAITPVCLVRKTDGGNFIGCGTTPHMGRMCYNSKRQEEQQMENRMEQLREEACNVKSVRWRQPDIMWCLVPARPMRRRFCGRGSGRKRGPSGENPLWEEAARCWINIWRRWTCPASGTSYIANIVKCRPPQNRDPKPEETACCLSATSAVSWKSSNRKSSFAWAEWQPPF